MPDLPWMCSVCTKSKQTKEKKAKLNWKHTNRRTGRSNSRQLLLAANWTHTNGGDVNDPKLHQATGMSNSAERVISYKTALKPCQSLLFENWKDTDKKSFHLNPRPLNPCRNLQMKSVSNGLCGMRSVDNTVADLLHTCKANQFWWAGKNSCSTLKGEVGRMTPTYQRKVGGASFTSLKPWVLMFLGGFTDEFQFGR